MKYKSNKEKQRAIRRLRIAAGQIQGLEKMVEEDRYCIDVLHQSLAIKEALTSFEDLILKNHFYVHVVKQMRTGDAPKAINEILSIYRLSKRK
ncbi:MAG: hypothetical protein A2939_03150 [Parcubacteria group bacterium RIFCSPLOWO2_01_FULL_48_18]|nr:MAG: hypothetical protein A3J67_01960 [Parcubacteria group bacterium RIFCSPHIGHO2_02_FULL_48_10b]OHB23387.1 MAG: hypothetical protein A2939_03150 [Parcubacteria group bacterium RIFCSPLOWO2_01_FULL_48_18]